MLFDPSIIQDALPPVVASEVAHYTRIGTLCYLLPKKAGWTSARATPVQFLNDRLELSLGLKVLQDVAASALPSSSIVAVAIENLRSGFGTLATDAFQMSFSGALDEIGQWRGYAANGMGCSILTEALVVKDVADVAGWVLYDSQDQIDFANSVLGALLSETDEDVITQAIAAAASFIKHDGFRPEMEFRLLKFPEMDKVLFRESGDRLVPYVDYLDGTSLPVRRIIVGPGWQLSNLDANDLERNHVVLGIARLLSANGLSHVPIDSSRIPYDPK